MAHKKLTEFLLQLANNHTVLSKFEKNPNETMKEAGLSERQAEIIKSKDAKKIEEAVLAEFPDDPGIGVAVRPIKIVITLEL